MIFKIKNISFLISLLLICNVCYSAEVLSSFEERNISVLNDELRDFTKKIKDLETVQLVSGMILLWSGAIDDIPAGWVLCDGDNDTPDLTDRFVIHADADSGGTNDVGDTGGANSVTLTAAQSGLPAHTHQFDGRNANGWGSGNFVQGSNNSGTPSQKLTSDQNSTASAASSHENRPSFYALAYIMKT